MAAIPTDRDAVMALVRRHLPFTKIAATFGVSSSTISAIAREHGYSAKKRIQLTAKLKAARRAASRPTTSLLPPEHRHVAVPAWAKEVADDFRDHARCFGEHSAARHCRRLLEEARAQERFAA